jgi:Hydantoinase/oxoprolinase N-terminal region
MAWQIGVDVGGTFTDLLALDPERGTFRVANVPSTPEDQSVGFIAGLAVLETDLAAVYRGPSRDLLGRQKPHRQREPRSGDGDAVVWLAHRRHRGSRPAVRLDPCAA